VLEESNSERKGGIKFAPFPGVSEHAPKGVGQGEAYSIPGVIDKRKAALDTTEASSRPGRRDCGNITTL